MEQELTMQGTIGSRIEQARLAANIDKNALAALVGKTAKTITHYEKGTNSPTVSTVEDIAKALTVDAGYLFCGAKMVNTKFDETEIEEEKTTKIEAQIDQLLELSVAGLDEHSEKAQAHIQVILGETEGLALEEVLELAEQYELVDIEAILDPISELEEGEFMLLYPEKSEADLSRKICLEVIERLIDKALHGEDLYSIDMEILEEFADENEIVPNRLISWGWRGYKELVPAIRGKVRDLILMGQALW